jgi:Tol biopolymer transport system component
MSLGTGTRIGAYEVVSLIGAGGMGEVYRARDTRLKRDVALKILPEAFSRDPDRLARFHREAELLATLTHAHIAAIYGLEESDGVPTLVLELVEGRTLAERIAEGPLALEEALPIARQIAEALEAAHERGIVHRDLKPANIKITIDGSVKVLDFGLAKLLDASPAASSLSMSPTLSVHATQAGVILGTAAYMSPEQARGKGVDRRADIWAFGCVLFEMLTARQAFDTAGGTVSDAVAAILRGEPEWGALPASTPAAVRRLLIRCLKKDSQERLHDIADARLDIDEALDPPAAISAARPTSGIRGSPVVLVSLAMAVAMLSVPAALYFLQPLPERLVTRLEIVVPTGTDLLSLALSPNGRQLAFVAPDEVVPRLWVRALDQLDARPLPGTDNATYPFWAPDGRTIGFFADGKLKRIDLAGGAPQTIADAPTGRGGTWSRDGTIVFAPTNGGGLLRVASTGGPTAPVTTSNPVVANHRFPQFLPDGRRVLFGTFGGRAGGIYVVSLDGGDPVRITDAENAGLYAPPGWLLVVRQATLMAFPFDANRAVVTGEPIPLNQTVGSNLAIARATLTVSDGGVMTYGSATGGQHRQLTWRSRDGGVLGLIGQPDDTEVTSINLSPDGRRLVTSRTVQGNQDVWVIDVARGVPSRLTFDASGDNAPVWSFDGQRIVFRSVRTGINNLFEKPASGAGDERPLLSTPETKMAYDSSPDGRMLLYGVLGAKTAADIFALPLTGNAKPFPVVQTAFAEDSAQFSPDGRWIAYESNETGRFEVYAQAFPMTRGKSQMSVAGGIFPRWSRDGNELYFMAPDGRMMAAPVVVGSDGQSLEPTTPVALFGVRLASGGNVLTPGALARPLYAVASDGRFLINEVAESDRRTVSLTVVVNWDAELP